MATILTGDFFRQQVAILAEEHGDGSKSPVYGLSPAALVALEAMFDALRAATEALAPAREHVAITPSDTTTLTGIRSVYVGTAGNVVATVNGIDVTYSNVPDGTILPIEATKIQATGTSATNIVGWK